MADQDAQRTGKPEQASEAPLLDRIIAWLGGLLVAVLFAYLGWQAAFLEETPPRIEITVESIEPQGQSFLVLFVARNLGGSTAAALEIKGEIRQGERTIEESRATIDFLPAHSARRGGLLFREDPRQAALTLGAEGYAEP